MAHTPNNGGSTRSHSRRSTAHARRAPAPQSSSGDSSSSGTCTSLYQQPAAGTEIEAYQPYNITWDCACLDHVDTVDITLYQYGGGAVHGWTSVPCADNSFATVFNPTWWNSTTSQNLQLQIMESGQPVWATTTGVGPSFLVNWNGTVPASHTGSSRNGTSTGVVIESVGNKEESGVGGGRLAAAVTVPLIAAGVAVLAYIVYSRRKGKKQRKRWSAYVDQRMSQYSAGDTSGSGLGRPSMSEVPGRPSISAGSIRPNSNFAGVGVGAGGAAATAALHAPSPSYSGSTSARTLGGTRPASSFYALDGHSAVDSASLGEPATGGSHLRNLSTNPAYAERVSRVSFADSSFTKGNAGSRSRPSSYFAYPNNGTGSASSPNHHRYKSSLGNSISLPRKPAPAAAGPASPDLASGIDLAAPHSLSNDDIHSMLSDSSTSPPIIPAKDSSKPKKHAITVSTSMPFMAPTKNARDTILSPDDLLAAYASNRALSQAATSPGIEEDESSRPATADEGGAKSGKSKFGFGGFGLAK